MNELDELKRQARLLGTLKESGQISAQQMRNAQAKIVKQDFMEARILDAFRDLTGEVENDQLVLADLWRTACKS